MGLIGRRTHKERAQPKNRRHLGVLEKHKDYVVRSTDFHRKRSIVKNLRQKAALRNEDEFYFKMHHQKMEKGKVLEMDRSRLQTDRHLVPTKRRHREYFNTVRQMEKRKIERLEEQVVQQMTPQKLIFVDEDATQAEIEAIESSTQHEPLHLKSNPSIVAEIEDRKQKLRQAARNAQTLDNHIELTKKGRKFLIKPEDEEKATPVNSIVHFVPRRKR